MAERSDVTKILNEFGYDPDAAERLLPLVFEELRAIARQRMRSERSGHTLQATALVNEAYMRLAGRDGTDWEDRGHFFRVAAEAMRRILIDHARKRASQKRGGARKPVPLGVVDLADDTDPGQVLALDDALRRLEDEDARSAEVVQLRFFGGLSVEDTARIMGISERTVMREWAFARARLQQLLGDSTGAETED